MTREVYDYKVGYKTLTGGTATAYLEYRDGDVATGTHKHTDEPVTLVWDGEVWREVDTRQVSEVPRVTTAT